MSKEKPTKIRGVIPALLTPFNEDETIDEEKLADLVEFLVGKGVNGFYINGSTGEGILMSPAERKRVAEIVIKKVDKRVPVIVHVGTIDTRTAVDLARHAYENGADMVSSVPPFYYRFSFEEIFGYYRDLAAATPLPVVVYNIPITTGVEIGASAIRKLAEIEHVTGIKYTSPNTYDIQRIKEIDGGRITVFAGMDEICVPGLFMGADALIGSTYNLLPEYYLEIVEQYELGELESARKNLIIANDMVEIMLRYPQYPALKLAMKWIGVDCGVSRRPFRRLKEAEVKELRDSLLELKQRKGLVGISLLDAIA